MNPLGLQDFLRLLVLAMPVAAISWTLTHEEVFREVRDFCAARSDACRSLVGRKFFYLFTCEYCSSHYASMAVVAITRFTLVFDDWRGYLISIFALVWTANHLMSLFGRLRLGIKSERVDIELKEAVQERAEARDTRRTDSRRPPRAATH